MEKLDLNPLYLSMSQEEKLAYFKVLGERILARKREYYMGEPTISDYEYDIIDRYYGLVANDLGLEPVASDQVGYQLESKT